MASAAAPGVLLVNLGTPTAPTPGALRTYLREFLGDRRVVDLPRLPWWLLLNLVILPLRPRRSARLYRNVWSAEGSPLLVIGRRQRDGLAARLAASLGVAVPVELAMRYGQPSVARGLDALAAAGCTRIVVLPLYPQYSAATVGTTFDAVARTLLARRRVPELAFVADYHDHPGYVAALAASVRERWQADGEPDHLLVSFHGIPTRYATLGDPYPEQCRVTAELFAAALGLAADRWSLAYQSRFGREEWLGPATDAELARLGGLGCRTLDVICPGFAADCLETLEEIAITGREQFHAAGGSDLRYIPALNDRPDHVAALADVAGSRLRAWLAR